MKLRLEDSTRGASGPTAEPQEGGASEDDTLLRTGRLDILNLIDTSLEVFNGVSRIQGPLPVP